MAESARETPAADRHVGVVGLAVMGENLALNIERNGFPIAVYNRSRARTDAFLGERAAGKDIYGAFEIEDFVASLARPRRILLMVKAGAPVDAVIAELAPHLQPGDILIDGGNSFFQDSERRSKELAERDLNFVGMGVSGGEEGALNGPSLMPGGSRDAYAQLEDILVAISAKTDAGPCVTHIGPGGSGHYVKMVHNGIEYGDMQLIAETYDLMRRALGMGAAEMAGVFRRWNEGKLSSYLIEVTAAVLAFIDEDTDRPLVDVIADEAEQKGTGRWTSQNALELGTPVPTIDAAVGARNISAMKAKRVAASKILHGPDHGAGGNGALPPGLAGETDKGKLLAALEDALYFAKVSSYAQGMAMLRAASDMYGYALDLSEIARIWKGGCIIRAKLLDPIREAFAGESGRALDNLLLAPHIAETVNASVAGARHAVRVARALGIPCPAMSASLDYVDSYRQERLPANLIQAQRDYFGAHTYKRLDREGTFHTVWTPTGPEEMVASTPSKRQLWEGGEGEGERSPRGGTLPPGTSSEAVPVSATPHTRAEVEDEGERSPDSTDKGEY
ncbi:MAG: 6-phosphogluconate dehydrogenase, decarboxylating [uncultured Thermomicrobiales bacterium]|uniref:6-phosphogluconate dehydrogenase, decarboxylating n=1 Tax=uncultured Thermomicrobiales bacterium TaxID=1645740 RepID=A0A6J4TPY4_9BACT|nr:MAG: 6-phosphogluconate dehydrogenase, decarboxylating [uncultured Thermomicrobiales bacterium]